MTGALYTIGKMPIGGALERHDAKTLLRKFRSHAAAVRHSAHVNLLKNPIAYV